MYCFATVPHSGSRYVQDTFRVNGIECKQLKRGTVADCVWDHWLAEPNDKYIQYALKHADKSFVVVRDPLSTVATYWKDWGLDDLDPFNKNRVAANLLTEIQDYYIRQNVWVQYYDLPAFRVDKDTVQQLGDFIGVPMDKTGDRISTSAGNYRFKEAATERDIDTIKEITDGTLYWERFCKELSPMIETYYTSLGYEFWWTE